MTKCALQLVRAESHHAPQHLEASTGVRKVYESPPTSPINDVTDETHGHIDNPSSPTESCSHNIPRVVELTAAHSRLRPRYDEAKLMKEVGGRDGIFKGPWGIASFPSGNIAITDIQAHCIHMLDKDRHHIRSIGSQGNKAGQFNFPMGVAVDSEGRLFVSDYMNHRVQVLDEEGRHLYMFGTEGSGFGQFRHPVGIAIDHQNRVYVCNQSNNRVHVLSVEGKYITTLANTQENESHLRFRPYTISINNHLVFVTNLHDDAYMYIFDDSGHLIKSLCKEQKDHIGSAVVTTSDPWGNMLLSDIKDGCVVVLDSEVKVSCRIGVKGKKPGQMLTPYGLLLTTEGDLLVCDTTNRKVMKYEIPKEEA